MQSENSYGGFNRNLVIPINEQQYDRALNTVWSDLHFGSNPHPNSQLSAYSESRRFAALIYQTAEYKKDHRSETVLVINILGDTFEGKLHDAENAAPETQQFCAAKNYLVEGICYLAARFDTVFVFCTPGNHGRNKRRHPERARSDKWDALETMLYVAVKDIVEARCTNVNVKVFGSHYFIQIFNWTSLNTHGDTIIDAGMPHKIVNSAKILNQLNHINANRHKRVQIVNLGHTHQPIEIPIPKGRIFINGGLLPALEYAISNGVWVSSCGAWIYEVTQKYPVGDVRFCVLDEDIDKDKSLDKIVGKYNYNASLNQ